MLPSHLAAGADVLLDLLELAHRVPVEGLENHLAQEPGVFVGNESVNAALHQEGNGCLPLILVDGQIISRAVYPDRVALAGYVGVNFAAEPIEPVKIGRRLTVLPNESKCC